MATAAIQPGDAELIESVANMLPAAAQEDFRRLMYGQSGQIAKLNTVTGNPAGTSNQNLPAPPAPGLSVAGANGAFTWTVTPPAMNGVQAPLWYEIGYSPVKGFTSGATTLEPTQATSGTLNLPGQSYFFRVRASLNKQVWSSYALASQAAAASGLVSSAATANGAALAQTNFGTVTSAVAGGAAVVEIQGAGGALTDMVAVKGGEETVLPAATVANVPFGSNYFVGYDGESYQLKPTLAAVLEDGLTPIGKVSVVDSGTPVLPSVSLVLGSGGAVIGWNVTNQGNGLTGPVTLAIVTSGGAGATPGAQTIQNGKLISVAPGNPGAGYASGDTVTVTGGVGSGTAGGGTSAGGNGGRLTAV